MLSFRAGMANMQAKEAARPTLELLPKAVTACVTARTLPPCTSWPVAPGHD